MKLKYFIVMCAPLSAALLLFGCNKQLAPTNAHRPKVISAGSSAQERAVRRVDDPETGVVCYIVDGHQAVGISCVKVAMAGGVR